MMKKRKENKIKIEQKISGYWMISSDRYSEEFIVICKEKENALMVRDLLINQILSTWNGIEMIDDYLEKEVNDWRKKEFNETIYLYNEKEIFNTNYVAEDENEMVSLVLADGDDTHKKERKAKGYHIQKGLGITQNHQGLWDVIHLSTGLVCVKDLKKKESAVKIIKQLCRLFDWSDVDSFYTYQQDEYLKEKTEELKKKIENDEDAVFDRDTILKGVMHRFQDGEYRWGLYKETMEEINKFIGMEQVNQLIEGWITEVISNIDEIANKSYFDKHHRRHIVFKGGPGTGKTTIARMVSKLLYSFGLIKKNIFIETGRDDIVSDYIGGTEKNMRGFIDQVKGGVLFIDEAYNLNPSNSQDNDFGRKAIDILVDRMEKKEFDFILIVAGYPQKMDQFLNANIGLKSRFSDVITFRDLNMEELTFIAKEKLKEAGYRFETEFEESLRKVIYRMKEAGKITGNVRDIEQFIAKLKKIKDVQFANGRINDEEKNRLTTNDLRKIPKSNVSQQSDEDLLKIRENSWKKLRSFIGNEKAKKQIEEVMEYFDEVRKEKMNENWLEPSHASLNMNFILLGPSGTGKTQWAKIIGEYLKGSGLLTSGEVKVAAREDFVSEYMGGTANKTKEFLMSHLGGVVFADEIYRMHEGERDEYGKEALNTILPFILDYKDEMSFIVAGYKEDVERIMKVNQGMKSRFRHVIEFVDYTPNEIFEIAKLMIKKNQLTLSDEVTLYLENAMKDFGKKFNAFDGNGRWVENLIEKMKPSMLKRKTKEISIEDIDYAMEQTDPTYQKKKQVFDKEREKGLEEIKNQALKDLNDLIGLEKVKEKMTRLIHVIAVEKKAMELGFAQKRPRLNLALIGPSGVGKTTVARIYAKFLKGSGLLSRGVIVEARKSDFIGQNTKETLEKTNQMVEKSLGGVLFFDEVYSLLNDSMGIEVINELVAITENKKDDLVVLFAGYEEEMEQLMQVNQGMKSRLGTPIEFEPYTAKEISEIFIEAMKQRGFVFEGNEEEYVLKWIERYENEKDYFDGNARWANNMVEKVLEQRAVRISMELEHFSGNQKELFTTITENDVEETIKNELF